MTTGRPPLPAASYEAELEVIAALYDAALDESLWPRALEQLMQHTGSQAASFWVLNPADPSRLSTFVCRNFDRKTIDEYLGGMASLDPTVRYLITHPSARIVHDGLLGGGRDEMTRNYLEWHERNVETRFRLVGQSSPAPALQAGVALHRARSAGSYEAGEIERFAVLHRHLNRALAIGARLGSLACIQQLNAQLLDRSGAGVVLLDSQRCVAYLNSAAEDLESRRDGLQLHAQGIRLRNESENAYLQSLIGQAIGPPNRKGRPGCEVMRASRSSGSQPYCIWVMSVSAPPAALTLFRPAVCILISDPDRQTGPAIPHLQKLFNMTPAEARLAVHLANGVSLRAAAQPLGITYGTARARLTQLFEKTGTRSQSALIRLLLTLVAPL